MILPWYARLGLRTVAALALVVLYGPLLLTVFFRSSTCAAARCVWDSFGLHWYAALSSNRGHHRGPGQHAAGRRGRGRAVGAAPGHADRLLVPRPSRPRRARPCRRSCFCPFVLPPIVTGLSLLIFFREAGMPRSLVTVTIGHTVFVLALVYQICWRACRR